MKSYSAHEIHGVKRGLLKWDLAHVMSGVWLSGTWGSSGVPVCQHNALRVSCPAFHCRVWRRRPWKGQMLFPKRTPWRGQLEPWVSRLLIPLPTTFFDTVLLQNLPDGAIKFLRAHSFET